MSRAKVLEFHRDNICSGAVRVGLEFLQVLPINAVEVVMHTDLLDAGSGHIKQQPVLYVRLAAQAVETLNLLRTDATALIERLGGHYKWSKRDGFRRLNLDPFEIPNLRDK